MYFTDRGIEELAQRRGEEQVTLAWLATSVILYGASGLRHVLGPKGLIAVERLMGMVLVTVSIQMLMDGLRAFIKQAGG